MHRQHKYSRRWSPLWMGLFMIVAVAALSWIVMLLWNFAVQPLFGAPEMNFAQGAALLVLCRILFGRLGPPSHKREHMSKRKAVWKEKWGKMSEEERTAFRARWKDKCGPRKASQNDQNEGSA